MARSVNNINFYVDGNLIEASGHNWGNWSYDVQPNPITIAKSWPMGNYFSGELDDIAIWDQALTSDNISAIMNGNPNLVSKGLVHYWNFDEGSGNTLYDQTENGSDGTIIGASWIEEGMLADFQGDNASVPSLSVPKEEILKGALTIFGRKRMPMRPHRL